VVTVTKRHSSAIAYEQYVPQHVVVIYTTEQFHIAENQNLKLTALATLEQAMNAQKWSKVRVLLFL